MTSLFINFILKARSRLGFFNVFNQLVARTFQLSLEAFQCGALTYRHQRFPSAPLLYI